MFFYNSILPFAFNPFVVFDKDGDATGPSGDDDTDLDDDLNPDEDDKKDKGVSQDKVNSLVGTARKEGRAAAEKAFFEKYDVKDADELEKIVQAAKDAEEANQTELEKANKEKEALEAKLTESEAETNKTLEALKKRVLDTEIKIAASNPVVSEDGKVTRPAFLSEAIEDVLLLISRKGIEEDEDGKYSGIAEALESLAKSKDYLTKKDNEPETQSKGSPNSARRQTRKKEETTTKKKRGAVL